MLKIVDQFVTHTILLHQSQSTSLQIMVLACIDPQYMPSYLSTIFDVRIKANDTFVGNDNNGYGKTYWCLTQIDLASN